MPMIVGKKIKLKWGNKGTAITMEDEMSTCRETCSFLPTEGNFNNVHGKSLKMATVWDYNRHVVKQTNFTAWPLKWIWKKILFCLLDFTILRHFMILASCSSILSHWLFRLSMVKALIEEKERVPWTQTKRQERQTPSTSQLKRLHQKLAGFWREENLVLCMLLWNKQTRVKFKCPECKLG